MPTMSKPADANWTDVEAAAEALEVSPSTVRRLIAEGRIGHRTIGRRRVYLPDVRELAAGMVRRRTPAHPACG
jgi:excisionase family DNA binding protein